MLDALGYKIKGDKIKASNELEIVTAARTKSQAVIQTLVRIHYGIYGCIRKSKESFFLMRDASIFLNFLSQTERSINPDPNCCKYKWSKQQAKELDKK